MSKHKNTPEVSKLSVEEIVKQADESFTNMNKALDISAKMSKELIYPQIELVLKNKRANEVQEVLSVTLAAHARLDFVFRALRHHYNFARAQDLLLYELIDEMSRDMKHESKKSKDLKRKIAKIRTEQARLAELYDGMDDIKTSLEAFIANRAKQLEESANQK